MTMIPMRIMAMQWKLRDINHNSFFLFFQPKPNTFKYSEIVVVQGNGGRENSGRENRGPTADEQSERSEENLEEEKKKLIAAICHFGSSKPNNLIELVRNRRNE